MKLSGLIIETSTVHTTKSARPLSIVKFEFQGDNDHYNPRTQILLKRPSGHFSGNKIALNCTFHKPYSD